MEQDPRLPQVRLADPAEADDIAASMARAFADDPALAFLLGDERREERLARFFSAELQFVAFPHEIVWTTDDLHGGAVWAKPGHWRVPVRASALEGPAMIAVFGRRLGIALWTRLRMERLHPKKPESYYLAAIGLDPSQQGKGLGSALMQPMLERMDAEGTPGVPRGVHHPQPPAVRAPRLRRHRRDAAAARRAPDLADVARAAVTLHPTSRNP